jgi:hypothetical protein
MNLGGLATGLSAVTPGMITAEGQMDQNQIRQFQLDQAQAEIAGKQALGRVFQQMVPGAQPGGPPPQGAPPPPQQPQQAPQAPPPGQASQPMRPPQPPPQQPPAPPRPPQAPPMQPGVPGSAAGPGQPGLQAPPGGPQGGQQLTDRFDLKTAAAAIAKANPGISPRILVEALNAAMPYLQNEAKQQVAEMRQQMQDEILKLRKDSLDQRQSQFEDREQRLKDENEARQKRFDTREARLEAQNAIKQDAKVQELALKQKGLEYKIAAGDKSVTMKQWRDIADAKRKAALAAASIYSANNGMDDKQKAKLAKDVNDAAEEEISNMRNMQGSSTPTGGTAPAGGGKTDAKVSDQPKPIPPEIRGQYDALVKEHPELRQKAIDKLKADGYMTDDL